MVVGTPLHVLAVIPARYASTRFPGKMIAPLAGKPLVWHTYTRACQAASVHRAVVATDDERIADALRPLGVAVVMTRADHASGTDRIAEVAAGDSAAIVVNVQGDEPLISPATVDAAVNALLAAPEAPMSTVRRRITEPSAISDPNVVKVVCDGRGRALYFSRHPIPYIRDEADRRGDPQCHWQHIGLYVYRRDFLLRYAQMEQTPLERFEKLEQLRVLENGYSIVVADTEHRCLGVDTPEDLERVRGWIEEKGL
ncbi:MAG TPA: 3-deoxy-manno-octulosonate cytidylyltransferase [Candidatus Hydrogenedentes bacterium]|nr:3-deoxy-manno-octulosonate cytidylyltransferase [Candidatus Hydrogenedentota bacterium]HPG69312.1 3-deoxy-manno-octulosonate cytidylyltransferase [Candidatus Hydrogenedentota bacterium]